MRKIKINGDGYDCQLSDSASPDDTARKGLSVPSVPDGYSVPQDTNFPMRTRTHLTGHVARRKAGRHEQMLWDDTLPGFGLRVQRTGHKSWIVKYTERGRAKKLTLGAVTDLSVHAARARARAALVRAATDGLPKRVAQRSVPTFERYVETFWTNNARHWKPATCAANRAAIDRELIPVFGSLPLDQIAKADVLRWRDDLSTRPGIFNRAIPVLAATMKYAEQLGYRGKGSNPCRGTPRYKQQPMQRFLSPPEYRRLANVLRAAEPEWPVEVAALRLLAYTGARMSEVTTLQWDHVQPPRLALPDSKTGPKTIPLNAQAASVLAGVTPRCGCAWVFPKPDGSGPTGAVQGVWRALRRRAALPDVRLHDLRHSFASVAIGAGFSLVMIGRLLGHALPDTTARYAHLADQTVSEAAERVSGGLARALGAAA